MPIEHVFVGAAVADLGPAVELYERLLGRPADFAPNENEVVWRLAEHASIYVVADASRAGNGVLTLMVDDLETYLGELAQRGITTGAVDTAPGLYRKAVIADPDGNRIQIGEALSAGD